jgi:phosphoribosyl-ATP pyrophosphohydrolase/phosphoribosyl-AMP cyclohydrolase
VDIDFAKHPEGLAPAIVQDDTTLRVLMLGYMNRQALDNTLSTGRVTFWSRSRNRLWTKGEESGNVLELRSIAIDCDHDTLLVKAHPTGPVCHTGADTCWTERNHPAGFLPYLEDIIRLRRNSGDPQSYVNTLFTAGCPRSPRRSERKPSNWSSKPSATNPTNSSARPPTSSSIIWFCLTPKDIHCKT